MNVIVVFFYQVQFIFSISMEISDTYSKNLCSSNLNALISNMDRSQHSIIDLPQYNLEITGVIFPKESITKE